MKTLFFELEDWQKDYINRQAEELDYVFIDGVLTEEKLPVENDAEIISVFVDSRLTEKVLDHFPKLKLITTRSTGYDHIDLELCAQKGIVVANVPSYGEDTVAEYTFALILTLSRKVFESYDRIKETGRFDLEGLRGFDLKGKTLGVIGTGRIGKNVIEIAQGFNMNIVAFDKFPDEDYAQKMSYEYLSFEEVLKQADVITLHLPYFPETHHLINEETIKLMKPNVYLINTARGALVDTNALFNALKDGKIAGAGLDVLEEEGVVKDELNFLATDKHSGQVNFRTVLQNHLLVDMPNVVITPHNAFNTWGALERILDTTIDNVQKFEKNQPQNLIEK